MTLKNNFIPILTLLTGDDADGNLETLVVGSSSTAHIPLGDVEVSVIVDVTGSMRGDIEALQRASRSLVNALLPASTDSSKSRIRISYIPYDYGVKLPNGLAATATFDNQSNDCVHARVGDQALKEVPHDFENDEGKTDYIGSGYRACPSWAELVPLTASRAKIEESIDNLSGGGSTAGQIGIAWGWYTISPRWKYFWPIDSWPLPYETKNIRKFAIFMKDGKFNTHYRSEYRYANSAIRTKTQEKKRNGDWIDDGANKFTRDEHKKFADKVIWYANSNAEGKNLEPSKHAMGICANMKAKDITIYSVMYGRDDDAEKVMRDCATNDDTFIQAGNELELVWAFEAIANDINDIYLSQ